MESKTFPVRRYLFEQPGADVWSYEDGLIVGCGWDGLPVRVDPDLTAGTVTITRLDGARSLWSRIRSALARLLLRG